MAYLPYASTEEADARSREMWTDILGAPKLPENVTDSLYGTQTDAQSGAVGLHVPDRDAYLDKLIRADQMTDAEVMMLVHLYPAWSGAGVSYKAGDLVSHDGKLYKVVQPHTSQPGWSPDVVPALFVDTAPAGVIPIWKQPAGAHDAYPLGFFVTHKGELWESLIDFNVWEPGAVGSEALWRKEG
jgi:hypothetical protein